MVPSYCFLMFSILLYSERTNERTSERASERTNEQASERVSESPLFLLFTALPPKRSTRIPNLTSSLRSYILNNNILLKYFVCSYSSHLVFPRHVKMEVPVCQITKMTHLNVVVELVWWENIAKNVQRRAKKFMTYSSE